MKFEIILSDKFRWLHHRWMRKDAYSGQKAIYFNNTWAMIIYWLWFEFIFYGLPE